MKELNCEQVSILLTYFIDKKLSDKLIGEIEYHLNTCPNCRERYMSMLRIKKNYQEMKEKICTEDEDTLLINTFMEREYMNFQNNLSSYLDNELDDRENIRIKKFAILSPTARQDLEDMIYFRQILQDSFSKTKSKLKKDLSELTIDKLTRKEKNNRPNEYTQNRFSLLLLIIISFVTSILILFYT